MLQTPTIRQIKYFIALSETLSFSKAAEQRFVTQSTLSASIKELENVLQQSLFERSSRNVILTSAGKKFLAEALPFIDSLHAMTSAMVKANKPLSGVMRMGIIPTIAPYMLADFILKTQEKYSSLDLFIEEDMTHILLERLEKGEIDTALIALPYDVSRFECRILYDDHFHFAINRDKAKDLKSMTFEALKTYNLLLMEDGHCLKDQILQACHLSSQMRSKTLRASSLDTILSLVEKGLGETLIPRLALKQQKFESENIRFMPFDVSKHQPKRQIGLIWRKSSTQSQNFEAISDLILELLQEI